MRLKRLALILAALVTTTAGACMGYLENTEYVGSGVICTYRLANGERVRVVQTNWAACPICLD
jgi:hypothetical protein